MEYFLLNTAIKIRSYYRIQTMVYNFQKY
jgi:hypothetical protein